MIGVLVVDSDDDLGKKAKIQGPVVGLENCRVAAYKLLESDPEDPDGNTIMKAIREYEEIEEKNKIIAIITGDSRLGYYAYKRINDSLDMLINKYNMDSVVLVTDGVSDESEIIPLLSSRRIRVLRVVRLSMKQASRIENTYMFIVSKLKDPYYSKLIFGIPGLILFIISGMIFLNIPTSLILSTIGFVLLMYGFNIPGRIYEIFNITDFRTYNYIIMIGGIIIGIVSATVAYDVYINLINRGEERIYSIFRGVELLVYPIMIFSIAMYVLPAVLVDNNIKRISNLRSALYVVYMLFNFMLVINFVTASMFYITFDQVVVYGLLSSLLISLLLNYLNNLKITYIYMLNPVGGRVVDVESKVNVGVVRRLDEKGIVAETDYREEIYVPYENVIKASDRTLFVKL